MSEQIFREVKTFDEACEVNIMDFVGMAPTNAVMWEALLSDLAQSLYKWSANNLTFYDCLLVERYIHNHDNFAYVRTFVKKGKALVFYRYMITKVTIQERSFRGEPIRIRIEVENPPRDLKLYYGIDDFCLFDNFTQTRPKIVVRKYAEMLAKLDSLYAQNVDKLGLPLIALANKTMKNDFINLFKRTKINALFTIFNKDRGNRTTELFYESKPDFILDKVGAERLSLMKELIQQLGVNTNEEIVDSSQYVNKTAIYESSLVSKYFNASMNKYRDNFKNKVNKFNPYENLNYEATVKPFFGEGEIENERKNNSISDNRGGDVLADS